MNLIQQPLLSREDIERRISEMWSAVIDIPHNDPDKDFAIGQAQQAENNLWEMFNRQEAIRNAAPRLAECLQQIISCDERIPSPSQHDVIEQARGLLKELGVETN